MKRHDTFSSMAEPTSGPEVEPTIGSLVGHLLRPIAEPSGAVHREDATCEGTPGYRLEQLLSREAGKRTFLATDIRTDAQVLIKLLLYCPDPQENEIDAALIRQEGNGLQPYELSAMLPYLSSFEVETSLGMGLALVKPYMSSAGIRQPETRQPETRQPGMSQSGLSEVQHIVAPPTAQQSSVVPRTAYADFRVKSSSDQLSIQFLESRVCAGIVADEEGDRIEDWLLTVLGTVVFVGGTVAMTGSIMLGVIVAGLLPILFKRAVTQRGPKTSREQSVIRLKRGPMGRTYLSLVTVLMPSRNRIGGVSLPLESKLHYSRLSVKTVTVAPAFFFFSDRWKISGAKLTFTFYNHDAPSSRLCIVGTYQEIRWIHRHLLQWAKPDGSDR